MEHNTELEERIKAMRLMKNFRRSNLAAFSQRLSSYKCFIAYLYMRCVLCLQFMRLAVAHDNRAKKLYDRQGYLTKDIDDGYCMKYASGVEVSY